MKGKLMVYGNSPYKYVMFETSAEKFFVFNPERYEQFFGKDIVIRYQKNSINQMGIDIMNVEEKTITAEVVPQLKFVRNMGYFYFEHNGEEYIIKNEDALKLLDYINDKIKIDYKLTGSSVLNNKEVALADIHYLKRKSFKSVGKLRYVGTALFKDLILDTGRISYRIEDYQAKYLNQYQNVPSNFTITPTLRKGLRYPTAKIEKFNVESKPLSVEFVGYYKNIKIGDKFRLIIFNGDEMYLVEDDVVNPGIFETYGKFKVKYLGDFEMGMPLVKIAGMNKFSDKEVKNARTEIRRDTAGRINKFYFIDERLRLTVNNLFQ